MIWHAVTLCRKTRIQNNNHLKHAFCQVGFCDCQSCLARNDDDLGSGMMTNWVASGDGLQACSLHTRRSAHRIEQDATPFINRKSTLRITTVGEKGALERWVPLSRRLVVGPWPTRHVRQLGLVQGLSSVGLDLKFSPGLRLNASAFVCVGQPVPS